MGQNDEKRTRVDNPTWVRVMFHQTASERTIIVGPKDIAGKETREWAGTKEVYMGTESQSVPRSAQRSADSSQPEVAQSGADSSEADSSEAEIERLLETDPALVPTGPSQFVV